MRTPSNRLLIATAGLLLIVGVLWFGGNLYLSGEAQRVEVLTAAIDIPRGRVLTKAMLGTTQVPRGTESAYLRDPKAVLDRMARVDILAGTILLPSMLANSPPPEGRLLPSGMVLISGHLAVAIPLDKVSAAGGALRVGDRVSVYLTNPLTESAEVVLPPLAQHVLVLDLYTSEGTSLLSAPAGRKADIVLLDADAALADLLMEATRQGNVRLVLEGKEE